MSMNRRDWLKWTAGAGAGLAVSKTGLDVQKAQATTVTQAKLAGTKQVLSACNFCSCGCGMVCSVKDGKLINLEGDSEHIINRGALCSKGAAMKAAHESDRRVKAPLYRAPGSDHWQQISWEDAYARITSKIKQTRDTYWIDKETDKTKDGTEVEYQVNRTDAIAFLGGAQNTNEECYLLAKMSRLLGSVWVEHQARL